MSRDDRFIDLASKVAELSSHNYRVGAIIVKGSRVLSIGVNREKTHPRSINPYTGQPGTSICAELDVIIDLNKKALLGSTIYVARVLKNGDLALAKPCKSCEKLIVASGIKRVVYSIKDGHNNYTP